MLFSALFSCSAQEAKIIHKLSVKTFKEHIVGAKVQLIDVRTPKEYKEGFIKDAVLMNFFADDFKKNITQLNTEKPVYVYCKSGGRSGKTAKMLKKIGFKTVYDLKGGYVAWLTQER